MMPAAAPLRMREPGRHVGERAQVLPPCAELLTRPSKAWCHASAGCGQSMQSGRARTAGGPFVMRVDYRAVRTRAHSGAGGQVPPLAASIVDVSCLPLPAVAVAHAAGIPTRPT